MNLLTIADGFGDSQIHPQWYPEYIKWPEIVKLMTKGLNLVNLSRYGAGNEYIVNCIKENFIDKDKVLIQWAVPQRLDLVLDHADKLFWQNEISQDPVYYDNILKINDVNFWLSSGSVNSSIREYHTKYISQKQHELRSLIYIDYIKMLLESANIDYNFFLSVKSSYLKDLSSVANWIWHEPYYGMCEFRSISRYADLDLGETQPIPLIQYDYIQQFIIPNMDLPWRNQTEICYIESINSIQKINLCNNY